MISTSPAAEVALDHYKTKLLDLSKRNRLVNLKIGARSGHIAIVDELPAEVARILYLRRKSMGFKAALNGQSEADQGETALPEPIALPAQLDDSGINEAHTDLWLQTRLTADRLDSKLRRLSEQATSVIQEQGVNALFLALGMLHYFESSAADTQLTAPILLLPVALERPRAGQPFSLSATDDDLTLNPALAELLQRQFGLQLPQLPDIAETFDPEQYFADCKAAIAGHKTWLITDDIALGMFSFQKFVMFKELERHRDLFAKHALIRMMTERSGTGGLGLPAEIANLPLDREFAPEHTFQVVDADSSQQRALAAVARGHTMVLQGPPGTGKSQTITNLIAHALAEGKRILFVAEKLAALQVVHSRLTDAGLRDYCLELHSHHSNKKAFIDEMKRAWDGSLNPPAVPASVAPQLQRARTALNEYVGALHTPIQPLGWSPFKAFGELAQVEDAPPIKLNGQIESLTSDQYESLVHDLHDLGQMLARMGKPAEHPWRDVGRAYFDGEAKRKLESVLAGALQACHTFVEVAREAVNRYGLKPPTHVRDGFRVVELADLLDRSPGVTGDMITGPDDQALALIEIGERYQRLLDQATARFTPEALDQDHSRAITIIARHDSQVLKWFNADYRRVRSEWLAMRRPGYKPNLREQLVHLKELDALRAQRALLEQHAGDGTRLFGQHWRGVNTEWHVLRAAQTWVGELRRICQVHGIGAATLAIANQPKPDTSGLRKLAAAADQIEIERLQLSSLIQWPAGYLAEASVLEFAQRVRALQQASGDFAEWRAFAAARDKLAGGPAAPVVAALATGAIAADQAARGFQRAFIEVWLDRAIESRPLLRDFASLSHEARIEEFRRLDRRVLVDNRSLVRRQICDAIQERLRTLVETEGFRHLRSQIAKSRGHAPLRTTLRIAHTVVQTIKPCFMMSPMSVAQYLDPTQHHFDLIIFDEASQLTSEDALGAIVRGDQLVVVGDPKQLPPTSFFAVQSGQSDGVVDAEGELKVEDYSSVLEQLDAAGAPSARLRWHYRSRHESLIAFSNATYYQQELVTFPSADTDTTVRGLTFEYVPDGVYEGKGVNRAEARRVAEAVIAHARQYPTLSLGVGTFSLAQQTAVNDELERLRRDHQDLEQFFTPRPVGGFFVKNLENIQGDERDVIFLSVTYAKNANGQLRHNFGPINGENGWRRLNVLVTRASQRLHVFSSMHGDEIDLSKTQSQGARNLREFLIFAEHGRLAQITLDANGATESPFEDDVRRALQAKGYTLHPQVGAAGYRIDFGVVDEQVPGRFVCGVECDGATYHSSETARDRDRLRQQVLEGLGWRLVRVWSTDWFKDRASALKRLINGIEACREKARLGASWPDPTSGAAAPMAPVPQLPQTTAVPPVPLAFERLVKETPASVTALRANGSSVSPLRAARNYLKATLSVTPPVGVLQASDQQLLALLTQVVSAEAPLHVDDAFARVAYHLGDQKMGSRISARLDLIARQGHATGIWVYRNEFLYPTTGQVVVRSRAATGIPAERVALEEFQKAACEVLEHLGSCSREELRTGVRSRFGFNRTGSKLQARIDEALDVLIRDGVVGHSAAGLALRDNA